ncbi:hypothetical protein [Nocardia sp. NPDC052316]|uniref:hypothetical protein n=1 Tax=Nocardia sp. NPDC052316 TaxID=3364329 RepID=UPI0037C796DF
MDFEIVGRDAELAARAFDRQAGRTLYDIPSVHVAKFQQSFAAVCRREGLDASLQAFAHQVTHRERVRRAIAAGDSGFIVSGVPVLAVGDVPADRTLPIVGKPAKDYGWEYLRIVFAERPVAAVVYLDGVGVDHARLAFADADALNEWEHEQPIDGLADVVFWGLHEDEIAEEFAAEELATPDGRAFGWLGIPAVEAHAKAVALQERRTREPERRFAVDFRPHSHHWQVMAGVRGGA